MTPEPTTIRNASVGRISLICAALILMTLAVFWQVRQFEFVGFDDNIYVYENSHLLDGLTRDGIRWAFSADLLFSSRNADYWQPVTFLTRLLDFQLYGSNAGGHHLTNVFFHILNTLLLFGLLYHLTGALWPSAFAAALFAVHPTRVEAVAWVTARKDVLSTFFGFLTIWAYVRNVKQPTLRRNLLVPLAFALGLMSKPMLMTLPFLLLLIDFWPLRRLHLSWQKIFLEKWTLFVLSLISGTITYSFGQRQAFENVAAWVQALNAPAAYVAYIWKLFYPANLACFYPPTFSLLPLWQIISSILLMLAVTTVVFKQAGRRPYLAVGWLWFVGSLIPVIGLANGAVADRFSYVPFVGLFIMLSWGAAELVERRPATQTRVTTAAVIALLLMTLAGYAQTRHWKNSAALFGHALDVTRGNWIAYNGMGNVRVQEGRLDEALWYFKEAVRARPDYAKVYFNIGYVLGLQGKIDDAVAQYFRALSIMPNMAEAHNNIGMLMEKQGKFDRAQAHFSEAVRFNPYYAEAYNNLGILMARQGKFKEAIATLSIAARLKPGMMEVQYNLERARRDLENQEKNRGPSK